MRAYSDIDEDKERVVVTFVRDLTVSDLEEMASTSSKARVLHFPMLIDARQTPAGLKPGDAKALRALVARHAQTSRIGDTAVLVANDKALRTVAYLARLVSGQCQIRAFLERSAAEHWLGWRVAAELTA